MNRTRLEKLPRMLYALADGQIFEHPRLRMLGHSGFETELPREEELIPLPEYSKLFFIPQCPPLGIDPATGEIQVVPRVPDSGSRRPCYAVAGFLEPGFVRTLLPAADYTAKSYVLPMWAYTAVGYDRQGYWTAAFPIESNPRWDPRNYDDRDLYPAVERFQSQSGGGALVDHLVNCATAHHCFAAKNLFLNRWEAPLPVSRRCNASCLGCLSLQPGGSCAPSHERIAFTPTREEIVGLAVHHLTKASEPIVSFGQGCEGEPLTEYRLVADCIAEMRRRTKRGTINLNTNGSWPERMHHIARSGLDSVRISLNSARPDVYRAYYQPRGYELEQVIETIKLCRDMGLYTMVNYLVFPGINDQQDEVEALIRLIEGTDLNFIHFKNLCIDPRLYLERMPSSASPAMGLGKMVKMLGDLFPGLQLGYFNQPVR